MHTKKTESGIALVVTLLTLTVFSLMTLGFFYMVQGEQQTAGSEADNTIAFYGAESAVENMSFQLATLFSHTVSPTPAEVSALDSQSPSIPNVSFPSTSTQYPSGGYYIWNSGMSGSSLTSTSETIGGTGPLAGLQGVVTPFTLTAIADGPNKTEVEMKRQVQEVAVPIFEFGIFCNSDCSFFAGPDFNFGGRVATNGNIFLAEGPGSTLTLPNKVTAFKDVVTAELENGWTTSNQYGGTVNVVTSPGNYRALGETEGSVTMGPGSSANSSWRTISLTDYNGNLENAATGVKYLNMSFAIPGSGSQPINIIERAQSTDSTLLSQARLENQASMRILLSDSNSTSDLPDGTNAVPLSTAFLTAWYPANNSDGCHAPLAMSPGSAQDGDFLTAANTPLIGGYIEVDIQNSSGAWVNVTSDVLSQGITSDGNPCNASTGKQYYPILHLEEPVTNYPCRSGTCASEPVTSPYGFVPINMYDAREGNLRDNSSPASIYLNGVMNVIEIDVQNLQWWFANDTFGKQALFNSGYIVYFSDRRGNYNPAATATNGETGAYGNEDIINPASTSGAPDGVMEAPEDVDGPNANTSSYAGDAFDTYGATPACADSGSPANLASPNPCYKLSLSTPTPENTLSAGQAEKNAVIFFRHALRLVNGSLGNLPPYATADCSIVQGANGSGGFSVASENPVYVLGNYNASAAGGSTFSDQAGQCHVPSAVMADAVTLLSTSWNDIESFNYPTQAGNRNASTTYYRMAIMGGSNIPFQTYSSGTTTGIYSYSYPKDFGTDGGVHNFLRYLENWGGQTLYYRGSIVDFYYSRQATGVYKCCTTVYSPPTRGYNFDSDFNSIATLPPGTPRFTTVNALGFQQVVEATK